MKRKFFAGLVIIAILYGLPFVSKASTVDLTSGYWDVSGLGITGNSWDGSKLFFQTQIPQGSDFEVTGYFDWVTQNIFKGAEIFEGTFFSDHSLHIIGTEHVNKPPGSGIVLSIYDANVTIDGTKIIDGTWTSLSGGQVRGTWSANHVPIPGTVWLLGSGIAGLVAYKRKREN